MLPNKQPRTLAPRLASVARARHRPMVFGPQPSVLRPLSSVIAVLACSVLGRLSASGQYLQTNTPPESATPPSAVPFFGNAQSQPSSVSAYSGMQPAAPLAGTSQLSGAPPLTTGASLQSAGLLHWGFIHVYPHVSYDVSYGNGLQGTSGQQSNTLINEVSPGVFIKLGDHWSLDYTPTLRFYSSRQFKDSLDHNVTFGGSTTYQDWIVGLSQNYSATSQPLIETASQLNQQVYVTSLSVTHSLGSKLLLDLGVNQNFRYVDQGQQLGFQPVNDTREWSTMDWLSYKIAPRLSAGLGAGFTYDNLSAGPDITSEQFQGRVSWTVVNKLTLSVSGGADYRQFVSSPQPDLLSPIFSASAAYRLFQDTSLSLTASRSLTPSYYQDSLSEVTTVSAGLGQRLFKRFSLDVSGGYTQTSYQQTSGTFAQATANNYDMTSINVRLSTVLRNRLSASVFFQKNFISSGAASAASTLFNYSTTQYGLALGYHF